MAQYRYYKNQIRFNVLADEIAPLMSWPTQIVKMSEIIAKHKVICRPTQLLWITSFSKEGWNPERIKLINVLIPPICRPWIHWRNTGIIANTGSIVKIILLIFISFNGISNIS